MSDHDKATKTKQPRPISHHPSPLACMQGSSLRKRHEALHKVKRAAEALADEAMQVARGAELALKETGLGQKGRV